MLNGKKLAAIVTAAGYGQRMGKEINKPFIEIGDKTILEICLEKLANLEEIDQIMLVIREHDEGQVKSIIKRFDKNISYVYGKETREKSTLAGLKALNKEYELVLTHDGVRPFASRDLFKRVLNELKYYKAVVTAVKSKDTLKIVDRDLIVEKTLERKYVYNIQTPQAFDKEILINLYEKYENSELTITDDSELFEIFTDYKVKIVEGDYSNIKITTPDDLIFAKIFMGVLWELGLDMTFTSL